MRHISLNYIREHLQFQLPMPIKNDYAKDLFAKETKTRRKNIKNSSEDYKKMV